MRDMIKLVSRGRLNMGDVYDGVFRTILNDCRQLVIPVINEIFHENYDGTEKIEFSPNEHFLDQQDATDVKRITDTNFKIIGKLIKKCHLECESSYPDGKMTIRLFEYDAQIALDEGEITKETLTVTFPNTAVLHLRVRKKTPDKMQYVIVTPGGTVKYDVPVMKVQEYTLDDIFDKHLLMLLPFYIFSHESSFPEYNNNGNKLAELEAKYKDILERLDELEKRGAIGTFDKRTIIELSRDVVKEIAQKYENVQKGVDDIMGGALIETEARRLRDEGRREGRQEGRETEKLQIAKKLIGLNMATKFIMQVTGLSAEIIDELRK